MKISVRILAIAMACLVIGCNEDTVVAIKGDVVQAQDCEIEGHVRCEGTCIDPNTSVEYCGANEKCEDFTPCDAQSQVCSAGKCNAIKDPPVVVSCKTGEHEYDKTCEPDSVDHCGSHDKSCPLTVTGWADGKCESGQCVLTQCQNGMHLNSNICEADTVAHCGNTGIDCASAIEGWLDGACEAGACVATLCKEGYEITTSKTCEKFCKINGQVKCGEECIDPATSQDYCGADEKCGNYTPCGDYQICENGKCKDNVSAADPSFATDDGIPNGITLKLINKSGKDICYSGKFKVYIKQNGPQNGWDTSDKTYELECHFTPPTHEEGGWPHWHENKLTLAPDESKEYDFTEFTEYKGNGSYVQTVKVALDTYVNGTWYFFDKDNPGFIESGGKTGVAAIKLGFAALKQDGTRGDNAFILHVRPVKASDSKLEKGKKYNLIIYEAVTDSKYWHCD